MHDLGLSKKNAMLYDGGGQCFAVDAGWLDAVLTNRVFGNWSGAASVGLAKVHATGASVLAYDLLLHHDMKLLWQAILVVILLLANQAAGAAITSSTDAAGEPSIVEVQKAALSYHEIEEKQVSRWKRRARLSALLPRFEATYDRRILNDIDININENVYVGASGVTVGPDEGTYAQNANSDQRVGFKAVWYLNELIFNPDQIAISREARSLMRERQMLMAEVNKHFYERERLRGVIDALKHGRVVPVTSSASGKKTKGATKVKGVGLTHQLFLARVQFAEETAALDALTGGWFSSRVGDR